MKATPSDRCVAEAADEVSPRTDAPAHQPGVAGTGARVLVTGVGGFLGACVARHLLDRGCRVIGVDASAHRPRQRENLDAVRDRLDDVIDGDLLGLDLTRLLARVDAVAHLAGAPGVQTSWATGFDRHVRDNVVTTQRLLEAALEVEVARLVVASSSSVYGDIVDGRACEDRESAPLSPYGASKAAMEHVAGAYAARGLSIAVLRYFTVYGPGQRPDMAIHRMIESAWSGAPFLVRGDGEQRRSFTYVDDAARATVGALAAPLPSGTRINVASPTTASLNQVLGIVGELAGTPVPVARVPAMPGDPRRTAADLERAAALLGWRAQVSLADGIAAQVSWQHARRIGVRGAPLSGAQSQH